MIPTMITGWCQNFQNSMPPPGRDLKKNENTLFIAIRRPTTSRKTRNTPPEKTSTASYPLPPVLVAAVVALAPAGLGEFTFLQDEFP